MVWAVKKSGNIWRTAQSKSPPSDSCAGVRLNNAFIVIDEAQNCTYGQLKMILSRLGWHSTMVITSDPDQSDLLDGISGLAPIARKLKAVDNIGVCQLEQSDIVRRPLVAKMLNVLIRGMTFSHKKT